MLAGAAGSHQLTVDVTGNGYVTDATGLIHCPANCSASFGDTATVSLYAYPNADDTFQGWSDACNGTTNCSFSMDVDRHVGATFTGAGPEPTPSPSPSPTATPTPQPTPTPAPTPSPGPGQLPKPLPLDLEIAARKRQRLHVTHGSIRLELRCSRSCKATVKPKITVPHDKPATFHPSAAEVALGAHKWTAVRLKLPPAVRAAIVHHATRRHPAIAKLTASAGTAKVTRTVSLTP
jgi:List-Bact-rpt repeat protein